MLASVVLVNWRQPELTLRALEAVAAQDLDGEYEVVLVENEAVPGATDVFRAAHPGLVVVEEPTNAGFAGGVARGIASARASVIVLVNNDAVPAVSFLREGLAALEAGGQELAAVSAAVVLEGAFVEVPPGDSAERGSDVLVGLDGSAWRRAEPGEVGVELMNGTGVEVTRDGNGYDRDWLTPVAEATEAGDPFGFSGGAVFLRRDALEAVGGFDESLFMYYEDLDVSWRLRLGGFRIGFAPAARIVHRHAGSSSSGSELIRRQSMRNRLLVAVRDGSAGLIARVAARTAGRLAADLARPGSAYLSRAGWRQVLRGLPRAVARARRLRGGPADLRVGRPEVESLLR